jgi:2-keto-4-pentenoate hydratase/2-oxohepta-3-ene-1,7-dioic acid hydratase in catechol pathway
MRLVTFEHAGTNRTGVVVDGSVYDLAGLSAGDGHGALPGDMLGLLALGPSGLERAASLAAHVERASGVPLGQAKLKAPIPRPGKLLLLANNYAAHIEEGGEQVFTPTETTPWLFLKPSTAIIGPEQGIICPAYSDQVDWEIELAVVIGTRCRYVPVEHAYEVVAGYTIVNDVSARRLNLDVTRVERDWDPFYDWLHGKWFDSFAPMGPYIATRDCMPNPLGLDFELRVNGDVRQRANTNLMLFKIHDAIAFASRIMTLEPGDVIAMGTAAGTGSATGTYLQPGDVLEAEIAGLGVLRTPVLSEEQAGIAPLAAGTR